MKKLSVLDWIALILLVVGGLNWLLVGFFGLDLVVYVFGYMTVVTKIVYALVGLAAVYVLGISGKLAKK